MNKPFANRESVLSIVAAISLLYGVQTSFAQGEAPTVTEADTNSSLRVSFVETLYNYDENAYQFQLRGKAPQGDWITDCVDISYRVKNKKRTDLHVLPKPRARGYIRSAIP